MNNQTIRLENSLASSSAKSEVVDPEESRSNLVKKLHAYQTDLIWTGNNGVGTRSYTSYSRNYTIGAIGKPSIDGSSDPDFRGDRSRYNPEELLVASLASCHMLWFLHLCSENDVEVVMYEDRPTGCMQEFADGSGDFTSVVLQPVSTVTRAEDVEKVAALHQQAHEMCFISRSMAFPVMVEPRTTVKSL